MNCHGPMPSKHPTCPKCRSAANLRLHARLPETDELPEVQCLECLACGEVVVVERVTSITQQRISSYWRVRETNQ